MKAKRALVVAAGTLAVLGCAAAGAWLARPAPGPLDAVPAESLLVVDVNVKALRESHLHEAAESVLRRYVPLDQLDSACGFATLSRLDRGVLTIGDGQAGGVGVALQGSLAKEELLHCQTQIVIGAKGVTKNQLDASSTRGSFVLTPLRLADVDLVLGLGLRRPLVIATPDWAGHMVDAADAPESTSFARWFSSEPHLPDPHRSVRLRLERAAAGLPLLLAASMKMPAGQTKLVASFSQFLPTAELTKRAASIEDPIVAGVSLSTTKDGQRTTVRAVIDARSAASATALHDVLLGTRLFFGQNLMLRMAGVGKLLDSLTVTTDGEWVEAVLEDATDSLADDVAKVKQLTGAP